MDGYAYLPRGMVSVLSKLRCAFSKLMLRKPEQLGGQCRYLSGPLYLTSVGVLKGPPPSRTPTPPTLAPTTLPPVGTTPSIPALSPPTRRITHSPTRHRVPTKKIAKPPTKRPTHRGTRRTRSLPGNAMSMPTCVFFVNVFLYINAIISL